MSDSRFFRRAGPFALRRIAEHVGGRIEDDASGHRVVDVAPLNTAARDELSFLDNRRYLDEFEASAAGACLVAPHLAHRAPATMHVVSCDEPYLAFALAARLFYPAVPPRPWLSDLASIAADAEVGGGCRVEPYAVIGARAVIGPRCRIGAGAVLEEGVVLGEDCRVGANAVLSCCVIGNRVTIDAGASIGTQGFGFAIGTGGPVRIPHTGRVVIADDVEVGANTTIDRGTAGDTVIGAGTMIDNLVQIAHNVRIGRGCVLAGQVGLAGSVQVADHAMLGGQVGVANHVSIGERARLGGQAGAARNVPGEGTYFGTPAIPIKEFWRREVMQRRLAGRERKA